MKKYKPNLPENILLKEPNTAYINTGSMGFIQLAREGVPFKSLIGLSEKLAFSLNELAGILHVSMRTLQRYTPEKLLNADASSKAIQLANLRIHGLAVFGNEEHFNAWLRSEITALGGKKPIDFLDTPYGFQLIDQLLGRIEHGIFA